MSESEVASEQKGSSIANDRSVLDFFRVESILKSKVDLKKQEKENKRLGTCTMGFQKSVTRISTKSK